MSGARWIARGIGLLAAASISAIPAAAPAETVNHVVGRGHTLEAIANRYHVSTASIAQANHIKDAKHLRVGDNLTIPGVVVSSRAGAKGKAGGAHPVTYAMRPRTPGVLHVARLATTEDVSFRVNDRRGHVSPNAIKNSERLLRFPTGQTHPIDARLLSLLAVVSDHFGSRKIEVISGFRPYTPTQHTPHSNHNVGKAIDFRVVGVPNEVLRDFCRTLRNVGVGYYPNSTFVHLDVRPAQSGSVFWIDYSKPGEPPRYNAPNVDADEGTSDVADDPHPAPAATTGDAAPTATPAPTPAETPPAIPAPSATTAPAATPAPTPNAD